jgi:hypothetical protein
MHHLPSFRNSSNACNLLLAAAGKKTGSFFPAKKAQDVHQGEVRCVSFLVLAGKSFWCYVRT